MCQDPPNFAYYIGINQTLDVECRILNANPNRITYEWNLENINHGVKSVPQYQTNSFNRNLNGNKFSNDLDSLYMPLAEPLLNNGNQRQSPNYEVIGGEQQKNLLFNKNMPSRQFPNLKIGNEDTNKLSKEANIVNDGLNSRFKWRPNSLADFGTVKCKAVNEIGSTECTYELKLGGVLTEI